MPPIQLFGFEISSKKEREEAKSQNLLAITAKEDAGESTEVEGIANFGAYSGISIDLDGSIKEESNLITLYRTMALYPEVDYAIDDIVNEAIVASDKKFPVAINLDHIEYTATIKKKISEEFDEVLGLLDFNNQAYDIFRKWYIDGRLYYHVVIDKTEPNLGIQELRYIDPRKIKKIKEINKKSNTKSKEMQNLSPTFKEYYIYNAKGLSEKNQAKAIPIAKDSITYIHSGLIDPSKKMILSNLQKAVRPWNQLKIMEDAVVIYRISRAPERRIFYVDVGNLPKIKAEQYLKDIMTRFKNKVVYNASTGEVQDNRQQRTMLEDYWLPRREGGKGTEITTLPGGQNLGEIEDILFFRKKLYQALNVPRTRMEADSGFSVGRDTEITRDEVKFGKMIGRFRNRFSMLFLDLLKKQLILKNVINDEDWTLIKGDLRFNWHSDTHFIEMQDIEVMKSRVEILSQIEDFTGTYYSREWVRKNILQQTEEEIDEIMMQIEAEEEAGILTTEPPGQDMEGAPNAPMGDAPGGPQQQDIEVSPSGAPGDTNVKFKPAKSSSKNENENNDSKLLKTLTELIDSVG